MKKMYIVLVMLLAVAGCSSSSATKKATCTQNIQDGIDISVVFEQGKDDQILSVDTSIIVTYTDEMLASIGGPQQLKDLFLEQLDIKEQTGVKINAKVDEAKKQITVSYTVDAKKADDSVLKSLEMNNLKASQLVQQGKDAGASCTKFK